MLGKKSDVVLKLLEKYPKLIIWNCLNHRLELSIEEEEEEGRGAIAEVNGINHFQTFLDKLYSVYNQSAKNQREIEECAANIGNDVKKTNV